MKPSYSYAKENRVLKGILAGVTTKPKITIFSLLIFTMIMAFFAKDIKFEYDYLEYEPKNIPSLILQYKIMEKFDMSSDYIAISVDNIEQAHLISKRLKSFASIDIVDSISNFLPEKQSEKFPIIQEIGDEIAPIEILKSPSSNEQVPYSFLKNYLPEMKRLKANLQEMSDLAFISGYVILEAETQKLLPIISRWIEDAETPSHNLLSNIDYHQHILAQALKDRLELFKTMTQTKGININQIPDDIKRWYIGKENRYIISIFPKKNIWDKDSLQKLIKEIVPIVPHMTGSTVMYLSTINQISKDYILVSFLAFLVTFICIWLSFKSFKFTLLVFIPLSVGIIWMLGMMTLLNIKYNLVNIMAIPLVFALSVDEGIHVVCRFIEEKFNTIKAMASIGNPISVTSFTTIVGLGSLCFAEHRGIASLGYVIVMGVSFCYVACITILPAILMVVERIKRREE